MPIRNLGPCLCCDYPIGYKIKSIGGHFAGTKMDTGWHVEYEPLGDLVYDIVFKSGRTIEHRFIASSTVSNYTEPYYTNLTGTIEYQGSVYSWGYQFFWDGISGNSIYWTVDVAVSSLGSRNCLSAIKPSGGSSHTYSFDYVLWSFERGGDPIVA